MNMNMSDKPMMDKVREKHARDKKSAIAFWKEKIVDCYRLRLGDQIDKFHMNLLKEQVEAVKKERLRREEQQRMQREADMEAETTGRSCRGGWTPWRTGNKIQTALFYLIRQQLGLSEHRRPGWMRLLEQDRRGHHDSGSSVQFLDAK